MRHLAERPLVCLVVAFAAGIALASGHGAFGLEVGGAVVAMALFSAYAAGWRRTAPALAGVLAAGLGCLAFLVAAEPSATDISRLPPGGHTIVGTVAAPPRSTGDWQVLVVNAESYESGGLRRPVRGRLYLRLRSSQPVARGERWRLTGELRPPRKATNPGQRSEAARLASLHVSAILTVGAEPLAEPLGSGQLGVIPTHAFRAQRRALATLEKNIRGPYRELIAGVAASVVFGLHAAPPPREISEVFRRAGTLHLLVVSGAMVSMVFGMVFLPTVLGVAWRRRADESLSPWPITGRGRVRFYPGLTASVIAMLAVTYYAVLTEGGQAVIRAAAMGLLTGLALVLRRLPRVARTHGLNVDGYTLLAAAALAILVVQPDSLFQPGFQLSFAAILAILYLVPKMLWLLGWIPRWLAYAVAGTLAAQLSTFPILVCHYGQAPLAGLAANLLAIPLASVVLVGAMATCAVGPLAPWAAVAPGWVTGMAARGLVWVSSVFAALPGAAVEARFGLWGTAAWYAAMLAGGRGLDRLRMRSQPRP